MNAFIRTSILTGWNWIRILRVLIGVFILIDGIISRETAVIVVGIVLTLLPFVRKGCAPGGGCDTMDCKTK